MRACTRRPVANHAVDLHDVDAPGCVERRERLVVGAASGVRLHAVVVRVPRAQRRIRRVSSVGGGEWAVRDGQLRMDGDLGDTTDRPHSETQAEPVDLGREGCEAFTSRRRRENVGPWEWPTVTVKVGPATITVPTAVNHGMVVSKRQELYRDGVDVRYVVLKLQPLRARSHLEQGNRRRQGKWFHLRVPCSHLQNGTSLLSVSRWLPQADSVSPHVLKPRMPPSAHAGLRSNAAMHAAEAPMVRGAITRVQK